ncbi:hypothetical protein GCM10007108_06460 [Thermogymnomonas acidicola]|uniref:Cytochrome oxidase subunit II copper A binding domain-containing protein n=2 Tax=Thermogymnomonas acidicola TaxID=399579 RepID=A0AA37BQL4_9ARCH|nr:hypothetical protein GCM10007108_06460 [Thermogymnomonas acidicola]
MVRKMDKANSLFIIGVAALIVAGAIGVAWVMTYNSSPSQPQASAVQNGPYQLTLVITTNNYFNSTVGDQPAFFVLENGSLVPSTTITVPSGVEISITIICYDNGTAPVPASMSRVFGTVGNMEQIVNNTMVNMTQASGGLEILSGAQNVSAVNQNDIAHTFTLFSQSTPIVNIPVPPTSVVHAVIPAMSPGVYQWHCEAACGSGPSGWSGAMDTPGWMTGGFIVS